MPLIVRRERGVLNRGVYTATVVDPTPGQAGVAWNDRLVLRFGGGCGTGQTQGDDGAGAEVVGLLSRGYAVASSTFTTFQTHCNDVLGAETALMLKERVVETLGRVALTIGEGSSGGAIQQHLILQNYPGILDAAAAGSPFPDAASISPGVTDCGLLERYYATPAGAALNPIQRAIVDGHGTDATCPTWVAGFLDALRPSEGCPAVPDALRYDSSLRRGGVRCTMVDNNVATLGVDPVSGFANRALDNVGVQYGLNALNAGVITTDQFLDLNQSIGGYDVDGGFSASRTAASEAAIATAYAGGRVVLGAGDLRVVPLINVVVATAPGDIHDRFRAFSLRDRLRLPDGSPAPNHVIWTRRPTDPGLPPDEADAVRGRRHGPGRARPRRLGHRGRGRRVRRQPGRAGGPQPTRRRRRRVPRRHHRRPAPGRRRVRPGRCVRGRVPDPRRPAHRRRRGAAATTS